MPTRPVRTPHLRDMKHRGQKIAMLTAYDATMARIFDRAGIDVLLVGDSVGMAALGYATTLPVTLDVMVHHTAAVARGTEHALVVADMPFLTYQLDATETARNAGRLVQEGGAAAVKLEGGRSVVDAVRRLVDIGIPVMGHLGLLPQSVHQLGGYGKRGRTPAEADQIIEDAVALEQAGVFALVLESIPHDLARLVTARLQVPTIGIGAGPECDGQVLVSADMLGLLDGSAVPPFVRQYEHLGDRTLAAARAYLDDVRAGRFPEVAPPALTRG